MSGSTKPTRKSKPGKTNSAKNQMSVVVSPAYQPASKLTGRVAIITGGDSGIGRSVAVHFAKEGADVAIIYHKSDDDANETCQLIQRENRFCMLLKGDIAIESFCRNAVKKVYKQFGLLDILVNNAGMQVPD